jgi:predicted nuclease of predicted toxin-antitoxin system
VKLLFDQNLSSRLVRALRESFPGSVHVRDAGLKDADDQRVWEFAKQSGMAIISKDSDFQQRSMLYGHPPKVIWVSLGNCTTEQVERLIRTRLDEIAAFDQDKEAAFLVL